MKIVTQEGDLDVWDRPKDADLVTIKLSAKVAGAEEYFVKDEETEFTVEAGHFCPAVKIAVSEMKKGEAVTLKASPSLIYYAPCCGMHWPNQCDWLMCANNDEGQVFMNGDYL